MVNFGYPYNDLVICKEYTKDSPDYLHLIQYYYKIMNIRIYNTVNVHKRMLHKCVNTEVIVGSL